MKKLRRIVISDIHGCVAELNQLLQKTNAKPGEVIFLGDYVDTGPDSVAVVDTVKEWCNQGAIALLGNHDDLFLQWLEEKEDIFYYGRVGGIATINSCLQGIGMERVEYSHLLNDGKKENEIRKIILDIYQEQISFLQSLLLFNKEEEIIFVHAGIHPKKGLENTTRSEFLNIRHEFIDHYHNQEIVIFGHTQTSKIHKQNDIYFGENHVIGIDGGCAFGGQLNALMIKDGEFTATSVLSNKQQS